VLEHLDQSGSHGFLTEDHSERTAIGYHVLMVELFEVRHREHNPGEEDHQEVTPRKPRSTETDDSMIEREYKRSTGGSAKFTRWRYLEFILKF